MPTCRLRLRWQAMASKGWTTTKLGRVEWVPPRPPGPSPGRADTLQSSRSCRTIAYNITAARVARLAASFEFTRQQHKNQMQSHSQTSEVPTPSCRCNHAYEFICTDNSITIFNLILCWRGRSNDYLSKWKPHIQACRAPSIHFRINECMHTLKHAEHIVQCIQNDS